jgi:hypothetical protein
MPPAPGRWDADQADVTATTKFTQPGSDRPAQLGPATPRCRSVGRRRSVPQPDADGPTGGSGIDPLPALGDVHLASTSQPGRGRPHVIHERPPALWPGRPGRVRRADRCPRLPLTQQLQNHLLQIRLLPLTLPHTTDYPPARRPDWREPGFPGDTRKLLSLPYRTGQKRNTDGQNNHSCVIRRYADGRGDDGLTMFPCKCSPAAGDGLSAVPPRPGDGKQDGRVRKDAS